MQVQGRHRAAIGPAAQRRSRPRCVPAVRATPPDKPSSSGQPSDGSGKAFGKPDDRANREKADFASYWSLKVREFFSSRRQYLELASKKEVQETELAKKFRLKKEAAEQEMRQLQEDELQQATAEAPAMRAVRAEATSRAVAALQPLERFLVDDPDQARRALEEHASTSEAFDMVGADIQRARSHIRSPVVKNVALTLHRARNLLRDILLLPLTLASLVQRWWSKTFTSQSYENFLLAEGERVWYWRNRMENERWFWEIFAWDRLIFPTLCTVAWEYICPSTFLWAVIIPACLITLQSGQIPSVYTLEFWLIAYFGFWRKCWPDFALALRGLMLAWGLPC